ncbi:hypothetical protein [Acidiphilium sp.]
MINLTKIRNLLEPPAPGKKSAGATPAPSDRAAEIENALHDLVTERAEVQAELGSIGQQRAALLARDGTDDQIIELDQRADRLRLRLERLDQIEPELAEKLDGLHAEVKADSIGAMKDRYRAGILRFGAALRAASAAREALADIREEAAAAGHSESTAYMEIPSISLGITHESASQFERGALSRLYHWQPKPPADRPRVVQFATAWGSWRAGERAGFPRAEAALLVAHGKAIFVGDDPIDGPTDRRIEILAPVGPFQPGERFSVPAARAAELVEAGHAQYLDVEPEPAEPTLAERARRAIAGGRGFGSVYVGVRALREFDGWQPGALGTLPEPRARELARDGAVEILPAGDAA